MIQPVPLDAKFADSNYYVWCGSCVKGDDGRYHLFYSRWPTSNPNKFAPGWAIASEVAYAIGDSPRGPFTHVNVALPKRGTNAATGQKYWDADMTHNPYCLRKDGKWYLYYLGNYGDGTYNNHLNHDRIGLAVADNPAGPWTRLDQPILDVSTNAADFDSLRLSNPAVTFRPDGKVLMIYKAVTKASGNAVRFGACIADSPTSTYVKQASVAGQIFKAAGGDWMVAEDPFIWFSPTYGNLYYAVVRDVVGTFTGVSGGLALFKSQDGLNWTNAANPAVLGTSFRWANGSNSLSKIERPWVLLENDEPTVLFGATDGYDPGGRISYNVQIPLQPSSAPMPPTVTWTSPSADARGSMPLGNGDISLNAWVEPSGDLSFYIGKTDSWGDNGRLLKVGKVRVTLDPSPSLTSFRQELSLEDASMIVSYGDGIVLRLWVDAHHPVVHLESVGAKPVAATAVIELWRTVPFELPSIECSDVMMDRSQPGNKHAPTIVEPDSILKDQPNRIGWFHHNMKSVGPAIHAKIQGMTGYQREDPLLHRTFGAVITAPEAKRIDDTHLQSASGQFAIHVLTCHPSTPDQWLADMDALIQKTGKPDFAAHREWWDDFWSRSWIRATSGARSPLFPSNTHPLRVGQDQSGQSRFRGEIRNVNVPVSLEGDFTLEAEVNPAAGENGRIFDQITPGGRDGFLLDAWPGNALRLIVGSNERVVKDGLPAGQWAKVVVSADANGWRVSVNGETVITWAGGDDAAYVSQMYALQRFITACGGRGRYPIKYNGSIFTVPKPGAPGDADYRRWGPGFWWQNTRLPYFAMPAAGDFDLMEPLFRMYVDDFLPLNEYRTKHYFGIEDAAYYPECVHFWGDVFNESYGWQPMEERKDPLQVSGYHKWEWVCGPELVSLLLDRHEYSPDQTLLERRIIPAANAVMRFFEGYYKTNDQGKLIMTPSQACETWWDCTNPMPELAGLHAITARLLALPASSTPAAARTFWKAFQAKLPLLPTRDTPDGRALAPAERFENKRNIENPELYAVFPFRLCSFEKENRDLGLRALDHRWDRGHAGWRQDDLFMTHLGLADQARQAIVSRARSHDPAMRFPAFWGPNYDWTPDQCHGGVLMRTFQTMLIQTDGRKIFLLPAWPKDWNVSFKLHAPLQTTVQGRVANGKVQQLKVTPQSRARDVVLPPSIE